MKKILIIVVIAAFVVGGVVLFTAFKSINKEKTSITADDFNTIMESNGYTMAETTNLFAEYGNFMTKSYAAQKNDYQIEFYQLSSEEDAISMYNTNKEKFELQKADASATTSVSINNYARFSLTANGKYKYVSRIDNTLIYVDVAATYKKEIKDIMDKIGY